MCQLEYMKQDPNDISNEDRGIDSYPDDSLSSNEKHVKLVNDVNNPFTSKLKNISLQNSLEHPSVTESTIESVRLRFFKLGVTKNLNEIKGVESQHNNLITYNQDQEKTHFSIINDNLRILINKKNPKNKAQCLVPNFTSPKSQNLHKAVPLLDVKQVLNHPVDSFYNLKTTNDTDLNTKDWIEPNNLSTELAIEMKDSVVEVCPQKHIIPEKFRNKKLPYLDKRIKTGYIKFFDEKNRFGFMTLTTEPFGEVFIFGNEFEKANIDPSILSVAANNPEVVFEFRVMYYKGKHGESKKAVNIRF